MKCKDLGGACDKNLSADSWKDMVTAMTDHVIKNHPRVAKQMEEMHNKDPEKWGKENKPKWEEAVAD